MLSFISPAVFPQKSFFEKASNQLYREALNIVQNKQRPILTRPQKLIISDFITGVSKQNPCMS